MRSPEDPRDGTRRNRRRRALGATLLAVGLARAAARRHDRRAADRAPSIPLRPAEPTPIVREPIGIDQPGVDLAEPPNAYAPVTRNRRWSAPVVGSAVVLLVVAAASVFFIPSARSYVASLKIMPAHANYTELYFADPNRLPTSVHAGNRVSLNIAFAIHDVEHRDMSYSYRVTARHDSDRLAEGTVAVKSGQTQRVPLRLRLAVPTGTRESVTITLMNLDGQSIHFWVRGVTT